MSSREMTPSHGGVTGSGWGNAAEAAEARSNGRIATELELGLPHELTHAQRRRLLMDFLAPITSSTRRGQGPRPGSVPTLARSRRSLTTSCVRRHTNNGFVYKYSPRAARCNFCNQDATITWNWWELRFSTFRILPKIYHITSYATIAERRAVGSATTC
jgi:MobA/MobL family